MNQYLLQQNQIYLPKQQITIIIQHKKGSGSQGSVFQGFIKNTNQKVAIKIVKELNPKEETILQTIQNRKPKYIIGVNAIEKLNNEIYIVMELAEMDFFQFMNTNQFINLDIEEKNELFLQMIQGVQEFHNLSYFHRDLKPENFVCCTDQQQKLIIKLIDFGISKSQQDAGRQTLNIGTPYYMASEVLSDQNYTKTIDIWSLGIIWYEMITRKPFFEGMTQYVIINQILKIEQNEIDKKIDQLNQVQVNFREIMKQMICINSQKRIKLEDVIIQIQKISEQQRLQKIEKELKTKLQKEYEQKEIIMIQKLDELQQKMKQDQENKIEQMKQQLQYQYNQQVINKEKELRNVREQQLLASNKNKELLIQQELQYQSQIDEYKKQCQIQLEKQMKEEIQIQNQLNEELIRQKQRENDELKKQIYQELEAKYYIEIQKREQELQVKAQNQLKKELNLKKQSFNDIIYLLKDVIKNSIIKIEKQKQEINGYQLLSQDKEHLQQKILNFIIQKQLELNKIIQTENNLKNLQESDQYTQIFNLEIQYKNYFQIHNYETNMINQDIQDFIIKTQKEQQIKEIQEKQKCEQEQIQKAMSQLQKKYKQLKDQFNKQSESIENIKIKCDNFSEYNNKVNEKFFKLKQKYCVIDTLFNQIRQFYEVEQNCISKILINYIQKQQQDIQDQLELFEETINELNVFIQNQKQELKNEIQNYLFQMEDQIFEIDYKIQNNFKDLDENQERIKNQLQEKQKNISNLQQQLKQLNETELSIPKYIQIRTLYQQEVDSIESLTSQILENQQKKTQLKVIQLKQMRFLQDILREQSKFIESNSQLKEKLNQIKNQCSQLQNQQINSLFDDREKELNEFSFMVIQKFENFNELSQMSKSTQEFTKLFNSLEEKYNDFKVEIERKKDEQQNQINDLEKLFQKSMCINPLKTENDSYVIKEKLKSLTQKLSQKNELLISIKNLDYGELIKQHKDRQICFNDLKDKIMNSDSKQQQNLKVIQEEKQKTGIYQFLRDKIEEKLKEIEKKSVQKSNELKNVIKEVENYSKRIQFYNLEVENKKQTQWIELQQSIEKLNISLIEFKGQVDTLHQSTDQNNELNKQYEIFESQVGYLCKEIPSQTEIKKFFQIFQQNDQSIIFLSSLIIRLKAYQLQRYSIRLEEYEEKSRLKGQCGLQNINIKTQYVESSQEQNLEKLSHRKALINKLQATQLMEKYKLSQEIQIYNREEQIQEEIKLDQLIEETLNYIKSQHIVKLKPFFKGQNQIPQLINGLQESREFCEMITQQTIYQWRAKKSN